MEQEWEDLEGKGKKMWLRERIWGEIAKREGHLRGGMKTQCSRIFLKDIKAILILFPNNKGDKSQIGHLLLSNEISKTLIWFYLIQLFAKGVLWKSPSNLDCC